MTLIDRLEAQVKADGLMVPLGPRGRPVLHPAVAEVTKARALLDRLLARLAPRPEVESAVSRKARHAAMVRWHGAQLRRGVS